MVVDIHIEYNATKKQIVNVMTKSLLGQRFDEVRAKLIIISRRGMLEVVISYDHMLASFLCICVHYVSVSSNYP